MVSARVALSLATHEDGTYPEALNDPHAANERLSEIFVGMEEVINKEKKKKNPLFFKNFFFFFPLKPKKERQIFGRAKFWVGFLLGGGPRKILSFPPPPPPLVPNVS